MTCKKTDNKKHEINVLGFGPIRLPAHDQECSSEEHKIKKRKYALDSIFSLKAIIRKIRRNT